MKAFDEAGSKDQHRAAYRLTILHEHHTRRYEEALHFAHLSSGSESPQDQRKRVLRISSKLKKQGVAVA